MKIKTPSQLKAACEARGSVHYFSRKTLKFFGDTMRNYGLRSPVLVTLQDGAQVLAYELHRKRPVKCGLKASHWFRADTLEIVRPVAVKEVSL